MAGFLGPQRLLLQDNSMHQPVFIFKGHFPLSEKEDSRVYLKYIPIKGVCLCLCVFCDDGLSHMEQLTGAVEERRVWLHLWVCGDLSHLNENHSSTYTGLCALLCECVRGVCVALNFTFC